jgi:hypothetical protein
MTGLRIGIPRKSRVHHTANENTGQGSATKCSARPIQSVGKTDALLTPAPSWSYDYSRSFRSVLYRLPEERTISPASPFPRAVNDPRDRLCIPSTPTAPTRNIDNAAVPSTLKTHHEPVSTTRFHVPTHIRRPTAHQPERKRTPRQESQGNDITSAGSSSGDFHTHSEGHREPPARGVLIVW